MGVIRKTLVVGFGKIGMVHDQCAIKDGGAAAVECALEVDLAVADEPYVGPGLDAALLKGQMHWVDERLVTGRIVGAHDLVEPFFPADMLDFLVEVDAFFVADHH